MDQLPHRLADWWRGLDDRGRRHASVVMLACVGYLVHTLVFCLPQPFFIEDAAITFAYARNLVEGHGLVTYAGGERVEGFSNPLWTFLMAGFYALGVPMWTAAKVVGPVFGVATLPLSYLLVRRARPQGTGDAALAAPLLLAASPQFVIWNVAGLENALFCILLSGGMVRLLTELQPPPGREAAARRPWSALLFFLLSMTRPEAMAYAAFAGVALALDAAARRDLRHLLRWIPAFILPFVAYQACRYAYFAWEFPNTYYAKLALKKTQFQPWNWGGGGWKYIRRWFGDHGVIWATPLLALAAVGFKGWRRWVVVGACAWLAFVIGWDGREGLPRIPDWWRPVQREWTEIRVWSIAAACAAGGLLTLGRPGWRARGLLWISACFGIFFALYSKGDWMKAHRWFNLVVVSLLPLLAIGLGELLDALRIDAARLRAPASWAGRVPGPLLLGVPLRGALLAAPLVGWTANEVRHTVKFANNPETSTRDIHRRVRYMTWAQRRLDIDDITLLDVDMGAHMYFTDWRILDIAGLVEVPIARHRDFNMDFMREYVFEEHQPEFAHVHGGWATSSKIPRHKKWKRDYIEIPGYPIGGRRMHVGNHIRKDTFIHTTDASPPDSAQRFEGGVRLIHARVPSPEVPAGGLAFVHTRWQAGFRRAGFRVLAILEDDAGNRSVQTMRPGWDWYPPEQWKVKEQVDLPARVLVRDDLPEGDYALSFVVLDDKSGMPLRHLGDMGSYRSDDDDTGASGDDTGAADPPEEGEEDTAADEPDGDAEEAEVEGADTGPADGDTGAASDDEAGAVAAAWDTGLVIRVVSAEAATEAARADRDRALAAARAGDCAGVWPAWKDGTRHILRDEAWSRHNEPDVRTALAACLVEAAAAAPDRDREVALLLEARQHDRSLPALLDRARPLAAALDTEGDAHFAAGEWAEAYADFSAAVALDPRRSWSRRKAEDARDLKLDITRPGREPPAERDEDDDDARVRPPPRVKGDRKPQPPGGPAGPAPSSEDDADAEDADDADDDAQP